MKLLLTLLAFINGGFMLADGIYVLLKGKYIGPDKPGPWAQIFYKLHIDVFSLGPMFIVFGVLWLIFLYGLWTGGSWVVPAGMVISLLTLWYLPIGTIISIVVFLTLLFARTKMGL